MIQRWALLILIALLCAACQATSPARTCDEIRGGPLHDYIGQPSSPADARAKIANTFGLTLDQVSMSSYQDTTSFFWEKDGGTFNSGLRDNLLLGMSVYYNSRPPSIAAVMTCLGAPDFYQAFYGYVGNALQPNELSWYFYFGRKGVLAHGFVRSASKEPPRWAIDFSVSNFLVVPVSSLEDTMARLTESRIPASMYPLKPWPGKLEDVVIEIDPTPTP